MSSSNTYLRDRIVYKYTAEQWARRIQMLQNTIYVPYPSNISSSLGVPTDMYGQRHYPDTRGEGRVPHVVNTTSRAPSRSGRSSYATSNNSNPRSPYQESSRDDFRQTYSLSRPNAAVESIRPRYRSQFDARSPPADFTAAYEKDSGYMSGEEDAFSRDALQPSSHGNRTRCVSDHGASPSLENSKSPTAPLRGILRNRSTPGSTPHGLPYEGGDLEIFHEEGTYRDPEMGDARSAPQDRHREPRSAVTPVIPRGTPYASRPRRLSEGGPLTDRAYPTAEPVGYRSRPPSVLDGPVIPGQNTAPLHSDGQRSRPASTYGLLASSSLQEQESSFDHDAPARGPSRPPSSFGHQTYSAGEQYSRWSKRASAPNSPSSWNGPQLSTPYPGPRNGREQRRIFFYQKGEPYYGFTNFSPHPVIYNGKEYPTSEHLFQSFKFHDYRPELAERIRIGSRHPSSALAEARRLSDQMRPDWFKVNVEKMYETLRMKFSQHLDLRRELLGTGDAILIEASDQDSFWGSGPDGKGRNELGQALMRLREELRVLS